MQIEDKALGKSQGELISTVQDPSTRMTTLYWLATLFYKRHIKIVLLLLYYLCLNDTLVGKPAGFENYKEFFVVVAELAPTRLIHSLSKA